MPYPRFDLSRLPLGEATEAQISIADLLPLDAPAPADPLVEQLGVRLIQARNQGGATVFLCDARSFAAGVSRHFIHLMERGMLTHLALDPAVAAGDWQLARTGQCFLDASRGCSADGSAYPADCAEFLATGTAADQGTGESLGQALFEEEARYPQLSLLAQAYRWGVPLTVHPLGWKRIGPSIDDLVLANSLENLDQGAVYQFGYPAGASWAFYRGLKMVRQAVLTHDLTISDFTAAVFTDPAATTSLDQTATVDVTANADRERRFRVAGDMAQMVPGLRRFAFEFAGWSADDPSNGPL